MGTQYVFEDAEQTIKKLTGQEACAKQIERLAHCYGDLLEQKQANQEPVAKDEELYYGMLDGGMVKTREDDWKEMKLGRFFAAKSHVETGKKRDWIGSSQYVAHLGGHQAFFRKVEKLTDTKPNMVWIADGAKWIWDWVGESYPGSIQILDYFHCKEYLCDLASEAFRQSGEREQWVSKQEDRLFNDRVEDVITDMEGLACNGQALQRKRATLTYFENNSSRMMYKTYRDKGLLIGSGPVEAAHRHVIQARLKRSGQRWTIKGAQQVATLRAANCSGDWETVEKLICTLNLN